MIDISASNKSFVSLVLAILRDKYDIEFTNKMSEPDGNWSILTISFMINQHAKYITVLIYYQTQTIDKLVIDISEKIDKAIIESYLR